MYRKLFIRSLAISLGIVCCLAWASASEEIAAKKPPTATLAGMSFDTVWRSMDGESEGRSTFTFGVNGAFEDSARGKGIYTETKRPRSGPKGTITWNAQVGTVVYEGRTKYPFTKNSGTFNDSAVPEMEWMFVGIRPKSPRR